MKTTYFDSSVCYLCFRPVLGPFQSDSSEFQFHRFKLKLARIALKRPQNDTETQVTHRIVEVSRFRSISFQYFELLYTIVTFPYKLFIYLRCYAMSYTV